MKTKTIITAMLLLFSLTSFAQTKEETIAWIKEKLEQHGGFNNGTYKNINVTPCGINYTVKSPDNDQYAVNFNPSRAKSWIASDDYDSILADAEIIQFTFTSGQKGGSRALYIRNGESGIHERMIKALTHLATFCEQKKEAF